MSSPRVLVVDDHALFRRGVVDFLSDSEEQQVVGEAATADAAVEQTRALTPDIVLLDLRLHEASGLSIIPALKSAHPPVRIIMLTMFDEPAYQRAARGAGAHGYVTKSAADTALATAIRTVHAGGTHFGPRVDEVPTSSPARDEIQELTEREREVVRLVARGMTNRTISERFGISIKSVESYRSRVMHKLGFRSREDLVRFALEVGLIGTAENPKVED